MPRGTEGVLGGATAPDNEPLRNSAGGRRRAGRTFSPAAKPASAGTDVAPTGALKPQTLPGSSSRAISRLDLSPPPGLLPDLPPEAQPPSFSPPPVTYVVAPARPEPQKGATAAIKAAPPSTDATPLATPGVTPEPTPTSDAARSAPPPAGAAATKRPGASGNIARRPGGRSRARR